VAAGRSLKALMTRAVGERNRGTNSRC